MSKWREVRGISPNKSDVLISAGCRYMNNTEFPTAEMLAAIIGLEEIVEPEESMGFPPEGDE